MSIKVKICGIKNENEALSVARLDVDFLGVIFAKSIRQVDPNMAKKISQIAHDNGKRSVGVFAGNKEEDIVQIVKFANLDIVQIYDNASKTFKNKLNKIGVEVWQVVSIKDEIPNLKDLYFDRILFDYKGDKLGGNGVSFDWSLLEKLNDISFIIAGGIGSHNVKEALVLRPYAIDVNSKVENANGDKDISLIKKLLGNM